MLFRKNDIVDYYDSKRVSCGLVLEVEERRLKILNDQGKETKISVNRALISQVDPGFPLNGNREAQISRLKAISSQRDAIKNRIDLKELWEIVGVEAEEISIEDLSELFFGKSQDADTTASLLRAIFEDKLYFRLKADIIEVPPPERIQQALIQREREQERNRFCARASDFLVRIKNSEQVSIEDAPEGLVELLEQSALMGRDWLENKIAKEIFSQAGILHQWDPFKVLVKLGIWSEDENLTIKAENIPVEFSADNEALAQTAARKSIAGDREDLTHLHIITIDSILTKDIDDALSLTCTDDGIELGVHITDVAHFIEHDTDLDRVIRKRAVSIYLPEMIIPMIPRILSEDAASLNEGEIRPAISLFLNFNKDMSLRDYRVVQSIIRVSERLSYDDVDERISQASETESKLYEIAKRLRRNRIESGAIIFKDPELFVHLEQDGRIQVQTRDRETASQVLVSEIMILANRTYAAYLKQNEVPAIYRSQPPPLERIDLGDEYDPVTSYRCKKALSRGDLSTQPGTHSTLGLDIYTTGTSPLRRYTDLIIQRQIKAVLTNSEPLDLAEVEEVLMEIYSKLERAVQLERERQKYFLLRYLEQRKGEEFECVVLQRFPKFQLIQIASLGFNAALATPGNLVLNPRDRCIARIEKINPRAEKLSFSLVKLL